MNALADVPAASVSHGLARQLLAGTFKLGTGVLLCLTPFTAVVFLGWLTRKTARDVSARMAGQRRAPWPGYVLGEPGVSGRGVQRLLGGLVANVIAGVRTWLGTLCLTLPFSVVWMVGWLAGWENSFNKGYELAGLWPLLSLCSVLASIPVLVVLPMAVVHQAYTGRLAAVFEVRSIVYLIRAAGWRYLVPTVLIAIGNIGVLGARALPTFVEQISPAVVNGAPDAHATFAAQFSLATTSLLVVGLLVLRRNMTWCYAAALRLGEAGQRAGILSSALVLMVSGVLWLGMVFLVYVAQFLNFSWWNWLNQPVLMLPWLG